MVKLERLIQRDNSSLLFDENETPVDAFRVGNIITVRAVNPTLLSENVIAELSANNSQIIPKKANAYTISDFNPDTQFVIGERAYSCYSIQFYFI